MIKNWKNAASDIAKTRRAASASIKRFEVRRLNKNGELSKMSAHPQFDLFDCQNSADTRRSELEALNPGVKFTVLDRSCR